MTNEKKEVQDKILFIYKQLLPLLEANNINFSANGGTCLGAIRHGGFIPWDDDMDINIMPDDKIKFIELLNELPDCFTWKKTQFDLYKVYLNGVNYKGSKVFIDFMVHDYVIKYNKITYILLTILNLHFFYSWRNKNKYGFKLEVVKWVVRITTFWIPTALSKKLYLKLIHSNKKKYISRTRISTAYKRSIHKKEVYLNNKKVLFEDTYIYVPIKYDLYLTKEYGDWRTPINQNRVHYK